MLRNWGKGGRGGVNIVLIIKSYDLLSYTSWFSPIVAECILPSLSDKEILSITSLCTNYRMFISSAVKKDYVHSWLVKILKMLSAPMNAFVYIAFSSRLQRYIRLQVRRASESLIISNDSYRSDHTMATICNKSLYACRKHVTSIWEITVRREKVVLF